MVANCHNVGQSIRNTFTFSEVNACNTRLKVNCSNQDSQTLEHLQVILTIQIKVTMKTLQILHMVLKHELQTAAICEQKLNILSNLTPKLEADFVGLVLTPKCSKENRAIYLETLKGQI